MKLENIKPGMTLYDVGTYKMGNTTLRSVGVWTVLVLSVDLEQRYVAARWNGNPPQNYYQNAWKKWRATNPVLVSKGIGYRLQTREEKKGRRPTLTTSPSSFPCFSLSPYGQRGKGRTVGETETI